MRESAPPPPPPLLPSNRRVAAAPQRSSRSQRPVFFRGQAIGATTARVSSAVRWLLGAAVFVSVVIGASGGLYRYVRASPRFAIRQLIVEGARHHTDDQIAKLAEVTAGQNVFALNLDQARAALLGDPWVQQATVTRKLPGTITIRIEEREATALVALGHDLYLAAAGGLLFKRYGPGDPTDLVLITGFRGDPEQRLDRGDMLVLVKAALELLRDYERTAMAKRYPPQEAHINDEGGFDLVVGREPVVLALGKAPYRPKLDRAARVLSELERRKGQATTVFLDNDAHPERVVARLR